ncbi:MAG: hypothetical protein IJT34_07105 [Butyrivibrio sp.]|nr:hypothetical protein [Butyrivibrio sp.]
MSRGRESNAYLTVYLSLTLTILLSLILTLFYGARVGAVRMKAEFVTDIAMNSILAEYHRELFAQYGLLMVDTSYGSGHPSILLTEEHLTDYVHENLAPTMVGAVLSQVTLMNNWSEEAHITGYSLAPDGGNAVLQRAIRSYMAAGLLDDPFPDTEENVAALEASGYDSMDVEGMWEANDAPLEQSYLVDVDEDGTTEEIYPDAPSAAVKGTRGIGILTLAAPEGIEISDAVTDETAYLSHRSPILHGTGLAEGAGGGLLERPLFDQYVFEKCGYFGQEMDKSLLKYQVEYMIAGTGSDWRNLETVCRWLMLWREASNFIYLVSDEEMVSQAEALALIASILLFVPELEEVIKWSILFAWSFAESVNDIHILLSGGRVPLVKTHETWALSIENLIYYRDHLTEGSGQGLDYGQYLRMLLFFRNMEEKGNRLMDVMEMDIRRTVGNERFRMDGCMDILRAEILVESVSGGDHRIERIYGYYE